MATDTKHKYLGTEGTETLLRFVNGNYVSVANQSLTDEQKAQVRQNIGVINNEIVSIFIEEV